MCVSDAGSIEAARLAIGNFPEPAYGHDDHTYILGEESSPRLALAHMQLSCPVLVNYRGGWFLGCRFEPKQADVWFEREGASVASVEAMLNHIHLQNYTFGNGLPMTEPEVMAYGQVLAYQWKSWARDMYGLDIKVYLAKDSDENPDVQIWFESQGLLS